MREFILNRIFEELKQANVDRYYAEELIDRQIISSRLFNIIVALLSTTGAIGAFISAEFPVVSSIIIALISIANQFYPVFFLKTEDLTKLIRLHTEYNVHFNKLQDLFCLAHSNIINEIEAQNKLQKLTQDNASKQTDISRIFGRINKRIESKVVTKSDNYLNTIYNG